MYKKDGRWSYMEFALEKELMMIGRLLIAGLCGGVIGHERENRRKPAGVRTHTVVGVASALMMLISKYGFNDFRTTCSDQTCKAENLVFMQCEANLTAY